MFFKQGPRGFFIILLFTGVGIVYNRGMRHRGTLRPLNKLVLPQSPLQATPLKLYVYIVNFFREVCNPTMHYIPIDLHIVLYKLMII